MFAWTGVSNNIALNVKKKNSNPVKTQKQSEHLVIRDANAEILGKNTSLNSIDHNLPSGKWLFRCMLSERNTCVIKSWLMKQSVKARANLDRTIEHLAPLPPQYWARPQASPIGDNIYVIHLKNENREQLRIFGHFSGKGTAEASFVMTLEGYEKDNVYHPQNYEVAARKNLDWCNVAHNRRTISCRYAKSACNDGAEQPMDEFHVECTSCVC